MGAPKHTSCLARYTKQSTMADLAVAIPFSDNSGNPQIFGRSGCSINANIGTAWVAGPDGCALYMDGSSASQGLKIKDKAGHLTPVDDGVFGTTFSMYVKFKPALDKNVAVVLNRTANTNGWNYNVYTNGAGGIFFHAGGTNKSALTATGIYVANKWYDLFARVETNAANTATSIWQYWLWEDGSLKRQYVGQNLAGWPAATTTDLTLGNDHAGGTTLNGKITYSDFRIWRGYSETKWDTNTIAQLVAGSR